MKRSHRTCTWAQYLAGLLAFGWAGVGPRANGQETVSTPAVVVTLRCEPPATGIGATAVLRAFAQVAPGLRSEADQIFSWRLDLLSVEPDLVRLEPGTLKKPVADADPVLSSSGIADGPHLRGIRDSFLDTPGAGVAQPIELFSIEVRALAAGTALFRLRSPLSVDGADPDFLVLPLDAREAWVGGDYSAASASLSIRGSSEVPPILKIRALDGGKIRVEAEVEPGATVVLEESLSVGLEARWTRVDGNPAPSATAALETSTAGSVRFFRAVRLP